MSQEVKVGSRWRYKGDYTPARLTVVEVTDSSVRYWWEPLTLQEPGCYNRMTLQEFLFCAEPEPPTPDIKETEALKANLETLRRDVLAVVRENIQNGFMDYYYGTELTAVEDGLIAALEKSLGGKQALEDWE